MPSKSHRKRDAFDDAIDKIEKGADPFNTSIVPDPTDVMVSPEGKVAPLDEPLDSPPEDPLQVDEDSVEDD